MIYEAEAELAALELDPWVEAQSLREMAEDYEETVAEAESDDDKKALSDLITFEKICKALDYL